jgi:hypothetical protein
MKIGPVTLPAEFDIQPPVFTTKIEDVTTEASSTPLMRIIQGKDVVVLEAAQAEMLMMWIDLWLTGHGR